MRPSKQLDDLSSTASATFGLVLASIDAPTIQSPLLQSRKGKLNPSAALASCYCKGKITVVLLVHHIVSERNVISRMRTEHCTHMHIKKKYCQPSETARNVYVTWDWSRRKVGG